MRALTEVGVVGVALIVAAGCAGSKAASACAPVPDVFTQGAIVYRECAVDTKAKLDKPAPVNIADLPQASGCFVVELDMVVDRDGHPNTATAKITRSNNKDYTDLVMRQLGNVVYKPAIKNGTAVAQLVHHTEKAARTSSTGSRPSSRRAVC